MPTNRATIEQRRAAAEEALERELRRIVDSGEYGEWFRRMSLFRRYAPANSLWIMAQLAERPDAAGIVASYRTWEQLGRQVRKGERGIMIWYPRHYWIDPASGDRVPPPASDADRARLQQHLAFGVGYVFDLSATEGEPLPELGRPVPDRAPRELADHLDRYCRDHRITVESRKLREGLSGYYQRDDDRVMLDADLSPGQRVAVLAHELAHREDPELVAAHVAGDRRYYAHNRPDCEAVAEAAAHTLSARFNHDITGHSAGYITTWIRGDIDRFKQLHERVGQVTRQLVPPDKLDEALDAARTRAKAQTGQRMTAGRSR